MNDNDFKDILKSIGDEPVPDDVRQLAQKASLEFDQQLGTFGRHNVREAIMRSPFTKLAAAATIVIAVLIGIGVFTNGSITYAEVIRPILNARTVILDTIIGDEDTAPIIRDTVIGSRIHRTVSNMPMTMIIDLDAGKMLALDENSKTAIYVNIEGGVQQGTRSYLNMVRNIVQKTLDNPDVTELGKRRINGTTTIGFQVTNADSELTIWADSRTAQPVRIEMRRGGELSIIKNIGFDVPVDESLVSMTPPAGYTLQDEPFDMTQFTEQDLVETLRIWAEIINDGIFPDAVSTEAQMQIMPKLVEKMGQLQGLSEKELTEIGVKFGRGMIYYQMLAQHGEWNYTGAGVKLGDAKTPICRFRSPHSQTCRVIYGDLSVKDAAPEELPK